MHQQHIWNNYLNLIKQKIPSINADWEIYFFNRKTYSVEGKNLEIDKQKDAIRFHFSIRVIKDKKAGFATCSDIDKIPAAFESAIKLALISDVDDFLSLPHPEPVKDVELFDEQLIEIKDSLSQILIDMQKSALFDSRIKKLRNAEIDLAIEERGIINSNGISVFQSLTSINSYIISVAEDGDSQMGWAYRTERFLKNINFEDIGREAASKALMLLNPQRISPFKGFAVLDPYVACEFLELISHSLSAENYLTGKSLFIDKIGHPVINEKLKIIDDGTIPQKFGSSAFDDEGVPTSRKILIEKGVLNLILHNTYTAKRSGSSSTGNAVRTDRGISVGPSNLYIDTEEQKLSRDELIRKVQKGVYIFEVMGMHTANPVSGDFSVGISGVYIENGQMKYPVREVVISGNVRELFQNTVALGNDLTFFGNFGSPTLLVGGIDISG